MKIIGKSNFDNEMVNDIIIAENVNEYYGNIIVEFMNEFYVKDSSDYYFHLEPDDYKLYEFEP